MNKRRVLLILGSLVVAILLVFALNSTIRKNYETVLSLQFEGIEKGVNPDGTRFNYESIVSEEALKFVAKNAELSYDPSLKEAIRIQPILPSRIIDSIKKKRVSGSDYTYYPNEFKVTLNPDLLEEYSKDDAKGFMSNYKIGYEAYFYDQNQYPFMDLDSILGYFDFENYDYPELSIVYEKEFNMIFSYLDVLIADDPEFVSSQGYSFKDIKETIKTSKDLELNQINALVNAFQLTKNTDELILKYQYMIKRYQLEIGEKNQVSQISDELLAVLEANKKSVLIPNGGGESMTIETHDESYDEVAVQATDSKMASGEIQQEVQYLQSRITALEGRVPAPQEVIAARDQVLTLVDRLEDKTENWVALIETTSNEYYQQKYENSITLIEPAALEDGLSTKMSMAAVFVLMIFILVFIRGIQLTLKHSSKGKW